MRFALIGQPNCGKSTLFNQVAGYRAETGNFAGTTTTFTASKVRVLGQVVELVDLPGTYTLAGILWGMAYLALGLSVSGAIPLSYSIISGISLLYFFKTKQYNFFCRGQLALILVLPFILQLSLGGFSASGGVIIWSILSPLGAVMFAGPMRAVPWFLVYMLLMVVSGFWGGQAWQQNQLPYI